MKNITEIVLERIDIVEEKIKKSKVEMENLKIEIERKQNAMANINFDYQNLYQITNQISNHYYELHTHEQYIKSREVELEFYYRELEESVTYEEYEKLQKQQNEENLNNMDKNMIEIKELFENEFDEMKIKLNGLYFSNTIEENYRSSLYSDRIRKIKKWVEIKLLDDKSYQYITADKNVNVKRKSTIIKYIKEFLGKTV